MKRAAMIYCANTDAPRYKVLKQRGQLPFVANDDSEAEGGDGKWANFSLDDAFRLRLMLDLVGGESTDETQLNGLGPSYAQSIVYNAMARFPRHPLNQIEPRDWWAGLIVLEDNNAADGYFRFSEWYVGELENLDAWVKDRAKRPATEAEKDRGSYKVVRIFLVNVSRVATEVRRRAEDLGLPEADDFSEVPI